MTRRPHRLCSRMGKLAVVAAEVAEAGVERALGAAATTLEPSGSVTTICLIRLSTARDGTGRNNLVQPTWLASQQQQSCNSPIA